MRASRKKIRFPAMPRSTPLGMNKQKMHAVCGVFVCVSKVAGSVNQRSNQQQQNAIIKCFRVIIQLHSRASFKATRATVVYTPKHHENHDSDKFCCSSTPFFTVISLPPPKASSSHGTVNCGASTSASFINYN